MISSNATEETVNFFLSTVCTRSPDINPRNFMSDFNWPQLNSIKRNFPHTRIYLCWWHVLHAWQQHFHPTHYPELWTLLKGWVRMSDSSRFDETWQNIKNGSSDFVPCSFIDYLGTYWMKSDVVQWWSNVYRQGRTIFENPDTNMLLEA